MKKILILAANPRKDLNLDREIRDLKRVIESSQNHEEFQVVHEPAVRVGDLQDLLFKHRPQIVHFCGHGGGDVGLMFESDIGREQQVGTEALSGLFQLFATNVECVLLNACYSETQADSIVDHIAYVIGMNQAIRDDAAIAFSKGFYRALGYACPIEEAFEFGCNAIQLEISGSLVVRSTATEVERKLNVTNVVTNTAIPEHLIPRLKKNPRLSAVARPPVTSPEQRSAIQLDIQASLQANATVTNTVNCHSNPSRKRWWIIGGVTLVILALGFVGSRLVLPNMAQSFAEKGLKQFEAGDRKNAESNYQWAIRLDPNNSKARLYLGVLYEEVQQLDQARTQYEVAARQDEFRAINNLARLYILKQQNDEASTLLLNTLKLEKKFDPETKDETKYAILKNLGWAKLQQGDYSSAGDYLEKAIAINNRLGAAHCLLAQVYDQLKDVKEAQEEWKNCRMYGEPSNPEEDKWLITAQQKANLEKVQHDQAKKRK